jgi:hypothetical protein
MTPLLPGIGGRQRAISPAPVDYGSRVILVRDGVCSSSEEGHDALLTGC